MRIFTIVCLVFTSALLQAQPKQNSPYSRYGLGDLFHQYFAMHTGMGGLSTADHDPYHLNMLNPASYAHLRTTALEAGLYAKNSRFTSANASLNTWSGNLGYLALGFTLKSPVNEVLDRKKSAWKYGMAFGLIPYSLVGYNIANSTSAPGVDSLYTEFQGSGGSYRLNWGMGAKKKNTSFGLNLGWQFGKSSYENTTTFRDSLPTFQNNFRDELNVRGLVWNLGVQHDIVLSYADPDKEIPSKWITLGLTAESGHRLNSTANTLRIRSRSRDANGVYAAPDTIYRNLNVAGKVTLPASVSAGIEYVKAGKLKVGAQFTFENWANYKNQSRPETLRNALAIAAGLEYIPDFQSYNRYAKRIRYRLGGYFRQDPRIVNTKGLNDVGLTMGLGLPLILPRQGTSFINMALEIGQLGAGTPIKENYYRMTVGFTLNDNSWFYKRRFE